MTNLPKIGIVIPNYQRPDYLRLCVKSILKQSYANFELVIVDDCSPNPLIRLYLTHLTHPKVKWHINKKSLGTSKNYALGVKLLSPGVEWVVIIDNDDYLDQNCLQEAVIAHRSHPHCQMIHLHQIWIDAAGKRTGDDNDYPTLESAEDFLTARCFGKQDIRSSAIFFNRKQYQKVGGYPLFPSGMATDPAFIFALTFDNEIMFAKKAKVYIRLHQGAESSTADNLLAKLNSIKQLSAYCAAVYDRHPITLSHRRQLVMDQLEKYGQRLIDALLFRFSSQVQNWSSFKNVLKFCKKKSIPIPFSFMMLAYGHRYFKRDLEQLPLLKPFLQRMKKIHVHPHVS